MAFFVKGEKIILKKDGTWYADGVEITHEATRDLFYRSIHWDETEEKYYLEVGYERIFIEVEDTPYFVTEIEHAFQGSALGVRLTDGRVIVIGTDSLSYERGNLYFRIPEGQSAKFLSAPYYDLLRTLQEDERYYYITIGGKRVNLSVKGGDESELRQASPKRR